MRVTISSVSDGHNHTSQLLLQLYGNLRVLVEGLQSPPFLYFAIEGEALGTHLSRGRTPLAKLTSPLQPGK